MIYLWLKVLSLWVELLVLEVREPFKISPKTLFCVDSLLVRQLLSHLHVVVLFCVVKVTSCCLKSDFRVKMSSCLNLVLHETPSVEKKTAKVCFVQQTTSLDMFIFQHSSHEFSINKTSRNTRTELQINKLTNIRQVLLWSVDEQQQ
jgi:hypothetical protein